MVEINNFRVRVSDNAHGWWVYFLELFFEKLVDHFGFSSDWICADRHPGFACFFVAKLVDTAFRYAFFLNSKHPSQLLKLKLFFTVINYKFDERSSASFLGKRRVNFALFKQVVVLKSRFKVQSHPSNLLFSNEFFPKLGPFPQLERPFKSITLLPSRTCLCMYPMLLFVSRDPAVLVDFVVTVILFLCVFKRLFSPSAPCASLLGWFPCL